MEPEAVEMGEKHPEWSTKYENICKLSENQAIELRSYYRKILMMRYETALLGLKQLKASKALQQVKNQSEELDTFHDE